MPLANRIRPKTLTEFVGQKHLVGAGKPLRLAIEQGHIFSFILWGTPGTGKTTLARMYANAFGERPMLGIADYGAFCAAILLFLALPGPGTFALLTSTAKGGFRAGAAATAGVIVGDQVLLWLAVAGVAALLAAHPTAFKIVQYAGAALIPMRVVGII